VYDAQPSTTPSTALTTSQLDTWIDLQAALHAVTEQVAQRDNALYLLALYALLQYWLRPKIWKLALIWLSLAVSLLIYEVSYPLVFFAPLLLVWLQKGVNRRVIRVSLLWYLVPTITFVRSLIYIFQPASMQRNLLEAGTQTSGGLLSAIPEMLNSLILAYARHFAIGWRIALEQLGDNPLYLVLGIVALVVAAGAVVMLYRRREAVSSDFLRRSLLFAVVGVAFIGLAILLYLPTSRRYEDWRVYYFSSIGGALATAMVMLALSYVISRRWVYVIFSAVMCLLVGLGTIRLLYQHQRFADAALDEQYVLGEITERVPQLTADAVFLLVAPPDEAPLQHIGNLDRAVSLRAALSFIYQNYDRVVNAAICYSPWDACEFTADSVALSMANPREYAYEQVLIFEASAKTGLTLLEQFPPHLLDTPPADYDPQQLINADAAPPARVHTLFNAWPVPFDYPMIDAESFAQFAQPIYAADQPVLLGVTSETCSGRSDCQLERWLSGQVVDVPESERFYITPMQIPDNTQQAALSDLIAGSDTVWYLQTSAQNPALDAYLDVVRADFGVYRNAPWNSDTFPAVTIYHRKPDNLAEMFRFGEGISLQSWTLHEDVQVAPCQTVTVSSWWQAEAMIDRNYSMTLVLAGADGVGVAQTDGAPAGVLTQLWRPGDAYLDERVLAVPCDIQPGQYALLMGWYDAEDITPLPYSTANGDPGGNLLYLTTLVVE
ncbi:MAG: hypothetical protein K8L99_13795, partial [Anaerolineae bacterium]|nr:hypothetical protein [Anaerolineae bacterium]